MTFSFATLPPMDWGSLALLALGAYRGLKNGAIVEFCTTGSTFVALIGSYYGWQLSTHWLEKWLPQAAVLVPYLSFALLFGGISLGIMLLSRLVRALARAGGLGLPDRLLGPPLGAFKLALLISAGLWGLEKLRTPLAEVPPNSQVASRLQPLFPRVLARLQAYLPDSFSGASEVNHGGHV